jgi:hypothetical protein
MVTALPFASPGRRTETVQLVEEFAPRDEIWQTNDVTVLGASRKMVAGCVEPFSVAVTVAV